MLKKKDAHFTQKKKKSILWEFTWYFNHSPVDVGYRYQTLSVRAKAADLLEFLHACFTAKVTSNSSLTPPQKYHLLFPNKILPDYHF